MLCGGVFYVEQTILAANYAKFSRLRRASVGGSIIKKVYWCFRAPKARENFPGGWGVGHPPHLPQNLVKKKHNEITTSDWIFPMSETFFFLSGNFFFSAHGAGPPPASFQLARVDSFCAQEQVLTRSRTFCRASGSPIVPRSDPQRSHSRYRLCVHLMLLLCGHLS